MTHLLLIDKVDKCWVAACGFLSVEGGDATWEQALVSAKAEMSVGHLISLKDGFVKFQYDPDTRKITNDDRSVSLEFVGQRREMGLEWLLTVGTRTFGFRTFSNPPAVNAGISDDGAKIWYFDDPFCEIVRTRGREIRELANTRKCESKEDMDAIIRLFVSALESFDGNPEVSAAGNAKSKVEFTQGAKLRMAQGEFYR